MSFFYTPRCYLLIKTEEIAPLVAIKFLRTLRTHLAVRLACKAVAVNQQNIQWVHFNFGAQLKLPTILKSR